MGWYTSDWDYHDIEQVKTALQDVENWKHKVLHMAIRSDDLDMIAFIDREHIVVDTDDIEVAFNQDNIEFVKKHWDDLTASEDQTRSLGLLVDYVHTHEDNDDAREFMQKCLCSLSKEIV